MEDAVSSVDGKHGMQQAFGSSVGIDLEGQTTIVVRHDVLEGRGLPAVHEVQELLPTMGTSHHVAISISILSKSSLKS